MMSSSRVIIVSHDAGGANLLLKWCQSLERKIHFSYCLKGPAQKVYEELDLSGPVLDGYEGLNFDWAVTSTGWQTQFELNAIKYFKGHSIPVASYLDHWANYLQRFTDPEGFRTLPDEIWIHDAESRTAAANLFKFDSTKIRFIRDRHFCELKRDVLSKKSKVDKKSIVICLEPIRNGIDKERCYRRLAEYIVENYKEEVVILRDHPAGTGGDMNTISSLLRENFKIVESQRTLAEDLAVCHTLFSYQSSVMVYAIRLGINALSFFPSKYTNPLLPHRDINYIS